MQAKVLTYCQDLRPINHPERLPSPEAHTEQVISLIFIIIFFG